MKILITGPTGFVGKQVLKALEACACDIKVVSRTQVYQNNPRIELIHSDNIFSESTEWWCKVLDGVDVVIHLAWHADPSDYLSSLKNFSCLSGTLRLAEAACASGIKRFIGIGTCFEYSFSGTEHIRSDSPLDPKSLYAKTKVSAFTLLQESFGLHEIDFLWCRLFYLYGEGEKPGRLHTYIRECLSKGVPAELGDGELIRDYLDVVKAGELIVNEIFTGNTGVINICSKTGVSIREIAEKIANEYGRLDLLQFGVRKSSNNDPKCIIGF